MSKQSFTLGLALGAAIPTVLVTLAAATFHLAVARPAKQAIENYQDASDKATRKAVSAHQSRY